MSDAGDLYRLFREACDLEGDAREAFLDEVRERDAGLAARLEGLLHQDDRTGPISPEPADAPTPLAAEAAREANRRTLEHVRAFNPAAGRYERRGEVGHGGMGVVHRVHDRALGRDLAMKTLRQGPAALGPSVTQLSRFLDEARVTGQLDHPGVVPVNDLGVDEEGNAFFTMRLIRGQSLAEVLDERRRDPRAWPLPRVLGVLQRVCETMAFAHSRGVIHRDLKPSNLMVGAFGEVYVGDWGTAKVAGQPDHRDLTPRAKEAEREAPLALETPFTTVDGTVIGTPYYMPPEQAEGRTADVDERSDVYALGAILYEIMARRAPYEDTADGRSPWAVVARILRGAPEPIGQLAPDAPAELLAICERAMARERSARYPDTSALAADLAAFVEGRVVAAYETGRWAETKKWVRRNPLLAGSIAAAFLILVVGLATALVLRERAERNFLLAKENEEATREQKAIVDDQARELTATNEILRSEKEESERRRVTAEENEARAKRERTRAVAFSDVIHEMIENAIPSSGAPEDLSVGDLLMTMSRKVDDIEDLDVRASVLLSVGQALKPLGRIDLARDLVEEGLRLKQELGVEDQERIEALLWHADFLAEESGRPEDFETAKADLDAAEAIAGRVEGDLQTFLPILAGVRSFVTSRLSSQRKEELPDDYLLMVRMIRGLHPKGTFPEGQTDEELREELSAEHRELESLWLEGRHQEVLDRFLEFNGPPMKNPILSERVAPALKNIAIAAETLHGRYVLAETYYAAAEAVANELYGADSYSAMTHAVFYAHFLMRRGRWEEARQRIQPLVDYCLSLRESDANTIHFVSLMTRIYGALGNETETDFYGSMLIDLLEPSRGTDNADFFIELRRYACALRDLDRDEEAEELLREALQEIQASHSLPATTLAGVRCDLAGVLGHAGREAEADTFLELARPVLEASYGTYHPENQNLRAIEAGLRSTDSTPSAPSGGR